MTTVREFLNSSHGVCPRTPHPSDLAMPGTYLAAIPRELLDMIADRVSRQWTPRMLSRWRRRLAIGYDDLPRLFPGLCMDQEMSIKFYDRRRVMIASTMTVYFYLKVAGAYKLQNKYPLFVFGGQCLNMRFIGNGQFIAARPNLSSIIIRETDYIYGGDKSALLAFPEAARVMPCGAIVQQESGQAFMYGAGIPLASPPHSGCIFDDHGRAVPHDLPLDALLMSPATMMCRVLQCSD